MLARWQSRIGETMPAAISTARWRDQPVVPADYEDVPALVKLAREARGQVVEFDWAFGRDDLQRLRRAVFEWGSVAQGRYKRFDARMLEAINLALGETDTVLVLNEPAGAGGPDCTVTCLPDGDGFRLRGRATFDIAFGWGAAAVTQSGPGRAFLGSSVRAQLADSVGTLGWDLRRLQDKSFDPVWNALYGLPLSYGAGEVAQHPGPELRVDLEFQGPFSAADDSECRCLFTDAVAGENGIYLWTIEVDGAALPWYVGQTRRGFGQRMGEHIVQMLAGRYVPHDPVALSRGDSTRLCEGVGAQNGGLTLPVFLRDCETLTPKIAATIRLLRFRVAPLDEDVRLLNRLEGAIGRYYKAHPVLALRSFFMPGMRVPAAVAGDQPMRLVLKSDAPIAGLPLEVLEPPAPMPEDVRRFVEATPWTFAKTYAATWPHEYVVRTADNAAMVLALARHVAEHGVEGRFYSEKRRYHHESGKVYWTMADTPVAAGLVNRCDETQTYEARLAAGTLPKDGEEMGGMRSPE
jgi:hypothetical protein